MTNYKLPKQLSNLINKKSATYKLTWMQPNDEHLDALSTMVKDAKIKQVVDKVYSFEKGIEAYLYLATGRAKGKVIISRTLTDILLNSDNYLWIF